MVKLIARTPFAGLDLSDVGGLTLMEQTPAPITLVAPFKGQMKAVSAELKVALDLRFPAPNRQVGTGATALWIGPSQALVMGASAPNLSGQAAVVDHTDAWAILRVESAHAEDVLARLVPVDLRRATFKTGHTARTLIGHMTGSVTRVGAQSFDLMVMRSMAHTLHHDVTRAARLFAGRRELE